ncbi:MAG: HEPN domain-containing protein [Nanoarchaeota archaeon]|nr:HEPN domain-containing protein [Nanoarchaeota archaeon]MBU1643989.1 HEPN domain-containing protein [Nanoarchaeota archaeon]MBU1977084.1 HEPN domain-containing protein [Nanoarchaeota archaeon]
MIIPFAKYLKIGKAKRKTSDPEEAKALLSQAHDRLDYVKNKEISVRTAKFVFEDAYEAVREAAQSLMSMKGFKPYSHEATISFIKEFHGNDFTEEDISLFDYFRQLRNDSVYKAVKVLPEDAKDCMVFAKEFVNKVKFKQKD